MSWRVITILTKVVVSGGASVETAVFFCHSCTWCETFLFVVIILFIIISDAGQGHVQDGTVRGL